MECKLFSSSCHIKPHLVGRLTENSDKTIVAEISGQHNFLKTTDSQCNLLKLCNIKEKEKKGTWPGTGIAPGYLGKLLSTKGKRENLK